MRSLIGGAIATLFSCAVAYSLCTVDNVAISPWRRKVFNFDDMTICVGISPTASTNEHCHCVISIDNLGSTDIYLLDRGYLPDCRVEIIDRDNKTLIPYTTKGTNLIGKQSIFGPGGIGWLKIAAGRSREWRVDLREFVQLLPGRFEMRIRLKLKRDDAETNVRLEGVTFDIDER